MLSFAKRVSIPDGVMLRELDNEAVILNVNSERYFGLDEMGTHMWQLLIEAHTIQQAYDDLLESYAVEPDTLRNDMTHLIEELVQHGLLEIVDA